jgi:hypothetical protein
LRPSDCNEWRFLIGGVIVANVRKGRRAQFPDHSANDQRLRGDVPDGKGGVWDGVATDPEGRPITDEEWRRRQGDWLPSDEDREFVASLIRRVTEPGKVAGWIAPPKSASTARRSTTSTYG